MIHPHRQLLELDGESVQVRPRVFALLLVLLEHPQKVLSKQRLLENVWDDVVVDEQVLFQTIRELRQLVRDPNLIKTYPRRGYAWSAAVHRESLQPTGSVEAARPALPPRRARRGILAAGVGLALLVALATIYFFKNTQPLPLAAPILVLPVKSTVPGTDHQWVSLGAMDQLIKLLKAGGNTLAMDPEYVLASMRRAELPRDFASADVARLCVVSGADAVIETSLSGYVEEYRLDYRLHFRDHVKRGTLFGTTVSAVVQALAQTVGRYAPAAQPVSLPDEFKSELMSRALEQRDAGDLAAAASLLVSLKALEAENLVARRLLAQVLIDQGETRRAEDELTVALREFSGAAERGRLGYWLAVAQAKQQQPERALQTLAAAGADAARHQDHLYLAYIAQLRGELQQALGRFEDAKAAFEDALRSHATIRCPLGEALTRLQLAALFRAQGVPDLAQREQDRAQTLLRDHQLQGFNAIKSTI